MIYFLLFLLLLLSTVIETYASSNSERQLAYWFRYVSLFCMFFLAAFRYETGGDWPGYKAIFNGTTDKSSLEPIFNLIVNISVFFKDYQYIFIISMIIKYICLHFFIKNFCYKYINNYSLFLLIYYSMFYFHDDFITVRQSLAVIVFLLSYCNIKQMNFKKYLIIVLLAMCIHYSSLVLLVLYPFIYKVPTRINLFLSFILFVLTLLNIDIVSSVVSLIYNILPFNYLTYMMYQYTFNTNIAFRRIFSGTTFVYLVLFAYLFYSNIAYFKDYTKRKVIDPVVNSMCFYFIIYFGLFRFFVISLRLSMFFNLFVVLEVAKIIKDYYRKNILISCMFLMLAFAFNKNIFLNKPSAIAYHPYQCYLFYKPLNLHSNGLDRLNKSNDLSTLKKQ